MITWHEMRQFQQPHHYTVWQWRFYPIVKTWKKWVMTLSSSMAMYSAMRDIPDARNVPMERGWVALYLYATCKFSNQLTLEQWAFEYGLPFFWYALYNYPFHEGQIFTIKRSTFQALRRQDMIIMKTWRVPNSSTYVILFSHSARLVHNFLASHLASQVTTMIYKLETHKKYLSQILFTNFWDFQVHG